MEQSTFSIRAWAEEDRPREKLSLKGRSALSVAELLAIILGSGTRSTSAVQLAQSILGYYDNDLNRLNRASLRDLQKFKGVGLAKGISILAALELGQRMESHMSEKIALIQSSKDAYRILKPILSNLPHEAFKIILLNRQNGVIRVETISIGGVSGTVVDPKIIFKKALEFHASSLILAHNHPSGNLKPSNPDIEITKKLVKAAKLLEMSVLDHLIISHTGYLSFADEGLM